MGENESKRKYTRMSQQDKADAVLYYEEGNTIRSIAAKLGVSYGAVNKLLKDEGLVRPRGVRPRESS
jgi:DNA-binding transcriptional regulator LsrR (DeoR family)